MQVNITTQFPLLPNPISAGFPSPALDFVDDSIDITTELIKHPSATFFGRADGNSMTGVGIYSGDLLVIDRSITPQNGMIAVCVLNHEFTLKRLLIKHNDIWLLPENSAYKSIQITEGNELIIWGIVTHSIRNHIK